MPAKKIKSKKLTKQQIDATLTLILNRLVKGAITLNCEHYTAEETFNRYEKMLNDSVEQIKKLLANG